MSRETDVVVGLGYVGLPLAKEAVRSGLRVVGLDIDAGRVESLNVGRSHIDDLSDAEVAGMVAAGFEATTDAACVASGATVVICVPTPLSADTGPDLSAVLAATGAVGEHVRRGTLVILESTTYGHDRGVRAAAARGAQRPRRGRRAAPRGSRPSASTRAIRSSRCATPPRSSAG